MNGLSKMFSYSCFDECSHLREVINSVLSRDCYLPKDHPLYKAMAPFVDEYDKIVPVEMLLYDCDEYNQHVIYHKHNVEIHDFNTRILQMLVQTNIINDIMLSLPHLTQSCLLEIDCNVMKLPAYFHKMKYSSEDIARLYSNMVYGSIEFLIKDVYPYALSLAYPGAKLDVEFTKLSSTKDILTMIDGIQFSESHHAQAQLFLDNVVLFQNNGKLYENFVSDPISGTQEILYMVATHNVDYLVKFFKFHSFSLLELAVFAKCAEYKPCAMKAISMYTECEYVVNTIANETVLDCDEFYASEAHDQPRLLRLIGCYMYGGQSNDYQTVFNAAVHAKAHCPDIDFTKISDRFTGNNYEYKFKVVMKRYNGIVNRDEQLSADMYCIMRIMSEDDYRMLHPCVSDSSHESGNPTSDSDYSRMSGKDQKRFWLRQSKDLSSFMHRCFNIMLTKDRITRAAKGCYAQFE